MFVLKKSTRDIIAELVAIVKTFLKIFSFYFVEADIIRPKKQSTIYNSALFLKFNTFYACFFVAAFIARSTAIVTTIPSGRTIIQF